MPEEHYLTPERLNKLKTELEDLKSSKRTEITERLKRAKELGDLSENSEYIEAREDQGQLEQRIYELEEMIRNAVLIKKTASGDIAKIGSTVTAQKNDREFKFTIVGANEARPEAGFISNDSPLGKALLNKKAGERAIVSAPAGEIIYKILAVE